MNRGTFVGKRTREARRNPKVHGTAPSILYLVGVPIGDPEDLSVRARRLLGEVDLLFCEDRRRAGVLFSAHSVPFPEQSWFPLNEHTTAREMTEYVAEVLRVSTAALISDAGLPVLSDPGAELVAGVRAGGGIVRVVPGPTAATIALVAAGLGNRAYHFLGFPPRKGAERADFLRRLGGYSDPVVLYETPYRLRALLSEIARFLAPETRIFLGVSLTGPDEFTAHFRVREISKLVDKVPKGPPALVIEPPSGRPPGIRPKKA